MNLEQCEAEAGAKPRRRRRVVAPQAVVTFAGEPFALVAESVTDWARVSRDEIELQEAARRDAARQLSLF